MNSEATLSVGKHGNVENKNKLVERKALVDSRRIKSADLGDEFAAFCVTMMFCLNMNG